MRKVSKTIAVVLTMILLIGLFTIPNTVNAETIKGNIDDAISWNLYDNGTLYVYGNNSQDSLPNYTSAAEQPWASYNSQIKNISISGISEIGSNNFCNLKNAEKVYFSSESFLAIGHNAFANCGLTSVTIPETCTSIGVDAFKNCNNLSEISINSSYCKIGDSKETIPSNALIVCKSGSTAEEYAKKYNKDYMCDYHGKKGDFTWQYTWSTKTLTISGNGQMSTRASSLFSVTDFNINYETEKVVIEDGITSICDGAFWGFTEMSKVNIANSVETIGRKAFYKCNNLLSVSLPSNLTSIDDEAFSYCNSLYSIKIPKKVKNIGENAFSDCGSLSSVEIPQGVVSIGETAFLNCSRLKSVTIPESVKTIGALAFGFSKSSNSTNKNSGFTIYGANGSAAETYAKENGFSFVNLIDHDISKWNVSGINNMTYTGYVLKQYNILVSKDGEYADFTTQYKNNVNVGTATVTITGMGDYTGTITKTFKITKAENPITVSAKQTVAANSKKKTSIKKAITVKKAQGKITYKTNNKKVTVKNGAVTIAKGLKKGKTYSVKVTITAKGNSNYKSKKIVKTVKIKVK